MLDLKTFREPKGITQKALAEKTDVTEQYIYMLERGLRLPHPKTAKRIAAVLGFDWRLFFEDEEEAGA